jgi:hypothetical protein
VARRARAAGCAFRSWAFLLPIHHRGDVVTRTDLAMLLRLGLCSFLDHGLGKTKTLAGRGGG